MKTRKNKLNPFNNPGALGVAAWSVGAAAVTGTIAYFTLREIFVKQVVEECMPLIIQGQTVGNPSLPVRRGALENRVRRIV